MKFTGIELSDTNLRDLQSFLDDQDQDLNKHYVNKSNVRDYISMATVEE